MVVQRGFQVACCSQKSAGLRTFENSARVAAGGSTRDPLRSTAERQQIVVLLGSLAVSSKHTGLSFLEGCLRAYSGKNPAVQLLSSGTEDFFLETVYFKSGKFANSLAGATRLKFYERCTCLHMARHSKW